MSNKMTISELTKAFDGLNSSKQVEVLFWAMDYMEQHNGRTKTWCIAKATADFLSKEMASND